MKNTLRQRANQPKAADKIEVEPGADKRLANILKKALNTPPPGRAERAKSKKAHKHKQSASGE